MSLFLDPDPTTTTSGVLASRGRQVVLTTGLLVSTVVGTHAGLAQLSDLRTDVLEMTGGRATHAMTPEGAAADEVASSRDRLRRLGLTRQQIARALGVDRRSLSGWATGQIRPTPERLEALRTLVAVATAIDAERPGRVPETMLHRRGDSDLLDQLTRGRLQVFQGWKSWTAQPAANATVTARAVVGEQEPIWAAAARAVAEGRLQPLERRPSVRADETYEMDPAAAEELVEEPESRPTRRGYS
jgi:transcriptional regulator with XRE-family HTH domain